MKRLATFMVGLFLLVGFARADFVTHLGGTVTADGTPVAGYKMLITFKDDTVGFKMPIITDDNGVYSLMVFTNNTYTITSLDSFLYEPINEDVVVGDTPVTHNILLTPRTDLQPVSGHVSFHGHGVATTVYFLKISDDINLNDFRDYETHFMIPGMALQWASYNAESDANGDFSLNMIEGNYVVYVPNTDSTLTHWGVFAVSGPTTMDEIVLKEMHILSGNVANAGEYESVMILAYSLNAGRPAMAMPDSNGDYSLEVAPGDYIVRCQAFKDGYMFHMFYDSVYTPQDATPVTVADVDVPGIDFNLPVPTLAPFSISGQVTSSNSGLPLKGVHMVFTSYNFFANMYQAYLTETDADGNYTVNGYTILAEDSLVGFAYTDSLFFAQFYNGEATFLTADPIVYHANENVDSIDFALDSIDTENAYSISGMLMDEDGNPIPSGEVTAYTTATNVGVITTMVDTTGHYAFDAIFPAGSTVYLQAWGGFGWLPEFYDNAQSWKDANAIMISDHNVDNINFTLSKVGPARTPLAKINGRVVFGGQNLAKVSDESPYAGAVVYARPVGSTEPWTNYDYVDKNGNFSVPVETDGEYEVKVTTQSGDETATVPVSNLEGDVTLTPTGISTPGNNDPVVKTAKLYNAYPNPFNPSTTIRVDLAKTGQASIIIYNVIGQKVKTLFNGNLNKGSKKFVWNGTDDFGKPVSSGLYFYQLKTANNVLTKAVMFLK